MTLMLRSVSSRDELPDAPDPKETHMAFDELKSCEQGESWYWIAKNGVWSETSIHCFPLHEGLRLNELPKTWRLHDPVYAREQLPENLDPAFIHCAPDLTTGRLWVNQQGHWMPEPLAWARPLMGTGLTVDPNWRLLASQNLVKAVDNFVPEAEWIPDCQGKWDFDAQLVCLSTRYWPGNRAYSKNGKPSATATIGIRFEGDVVPLLEKEFEGDSEPDVKRQVEDWVGGATKTLMLDLVKLGYGRGLK